MNSAINQVVCFQLENPIENFEKKDYELESIKNLIHSLNDEKLQIYNLDKTTQKKIYFHLESDGKIIYQNCHTSNESLYGKYLVQFQQFYNFHPEIFPYQYKDFMNKTFGYAIMTRENALVTNKAIIDYLNKKRNN